MMLRKCARQIPIYLEHFRRLQRMGSLPLAQEGVVFHCPLTLRKRHNLALQEINKPLLEHVELSLPHIIHVGVTTACNLRCPVCPTGTRALGRAAGHLDYDYYARMVDELRGALMFVLLWDWGEPLLHPRLADMVAHAKQSDIKTVIATNGTAGNSLEKIERLVAAQPDSIIVCVDGATQETYAKYRVGGRLSAVLETTRRLVAARERQGSSYPLVEFRSLATKHTEPEMPRLLQMAEETGSDLFSVKTLRPYDYRGQESDRELVPLRPELGRYAYDDDAPSATGRIRPAGPLQCGKPMYAPTLESNGRLVFCCYAKHEEEVFGRFSRGGVRRLWRSRPARHKRLHFLRQEGTQCCPTCYFRSDHKPTVIHTVPLRAFPPDISLVESRSREAFLTAVAPDAARERVGAPSAIPDKVA